MYQLGEASGRVFLVMEYLEGESLRERMARGPLAADEFIDVAVQVAKALEGAHGQGMVHRDIKPDNPFLTKQGVVKLMDFGLAKLVEEESGGAMQSSVTGTSGYMSPEQARGEPLDARSDIYSLGKVREELAPAKKFTPILNKALASDPAMRWQSAGELRAALEATRKEECGPPDRDGLGGRGCGGRRHGDLVPGLDPARRLCASGADFAVGPHRRTRSPPTATARHFRI